MATNQYNSFPTATTAPLDLSELKYTPQYVYTPSVAPKTWLPNSSTTPQGAVYNPKIGYVAPKPALNMPQMLSSHTTTAKTPLPNSVTPIPPPVKKSAPKSTQSQFFISGSPNTEQPQGGIDFSSILNAVQNIQPVQSYTNRMNALNTGNTTWDMNSLDKILAAKAEQQADTERYQQQVGALANLGSAQMNAGAARAGHEMQLQSEREKNAYMAPYYSALGKEAGAKAEAAPLTAKADVLKALNEQAKDDPVLKASLDVMTELGKQRDAAGYNAMAAKIAAITGKKIPPMPVQQ